VGVSVRSISCTRVSGTPLTLEPVQLRDMDNDLNLGDGPEPTLRLRTEELDWLPVDQEVVVLDSRRDVYLATNQTGAHLWRALIEGTTRSELIDMLMRDFEVGRETATADVGAYLDALDEQDLLEVT
jgi:Coenzyme PQQ synthesis protein D (PqqD)